MIVILPHELTQQEIFLLAYDMCDKNEFGAVDYEELEKKMDFVAKANDELRR